MRNWISKKENNLLNLFLNKNLFLLLFFLVIQQLVSASSNLSIANVSCAITKGNGLINYYLFLYLISILLQYFFSIPINLNLEKTKQDTFRNYVYNFSKIYKNIPMIRLEQKEKKQKRHWLVSEGKRVINDTLDNISEITTKILNTVFHVGSIYILTKSFLLLGTYALVAIFLPKILKFFSKKFEIETKKLQTFKTIMNNTLEKGWDNITIGNYNNLELWIKKFTENSEDVKSISKKLEWLKQITIFIVSMIAIIPIMGITIWLFNTHTNDQLFLTKLAVLVLRQVIIIQNIYTLSLYSVNRHIISVELKILNDLIYKFPNSFEHNFQKRINFNKISISSNNKKLSCKSLKGFLGILKDGKKGRITVTGDNGVGKTSLLTLAKYSLSDEAYYLPIASKLEFGIDEINNEAGFSTGEKLIAELQIILEFLKQKNTKIKVILLDEWDANIHAVRAMHISKLLDKISREYKVVEISHRAY